VGRLLALAILASLLLHAATPGLAAPVRIATLSVTPISGLAGSMVTLNGSGYDANFNPTSIKWDGVLQSTFQVGAGGSFSVPFTIPAGASPGQHNIEVCEGNPCYTDEFYVGASTTFLVVEPTATPVPPSPTPIPPTPVPPTPIPPSPTPVPPSPTPGLIVTLPPSTPLVPLPELTLPGLPEDAFTCESLGLEAGPDEELSVQDFESAGIWSAVLGAGTSNIYTPAVPTHSGTQAMATYASEEFGSTGIPLRLVFRSGARAIGLYYGMEEPWWTTDTVIVRFRAYGVSADGSEGLLGELAYRMPAAATPIENCLSYRAPDGATITDVWLEYTDAAGNSAPEQRIVDDVTIVTPVEPVAIEDDRPPVVTIISPVDGATIREGVVQLRASIDENRWLYAAYSLVNGSSSTSTTLIRSAAGGAPITVGRDIPASALDPYRLNTITVRAYDERGNRGEASISVYYDPPPTPTPVPDLNIGIYKIELVQVTQCLENPACGADNSIPLYNGKPTLVRMYVRATGTNGTEPNISGLLCRLGTRDCIPSNNRVFVAETDNPVRDFRGDLSRTLNFTLPAGWVAEPGHLSLQAFANPDYADVLENNFSDNWRTIGAEVAAARRFDVNIARVRAAGDITPPASERFQMASYFRAVYPINHIGMWMPSGDSTVDSPYDYTDSSGSGCGSGWGGLLDDLWWYNFWTFDPVDDLRYYGMVSSRTPAGYSGCGYRPGDESGGLVENPNPDWSGAIMAQEIGHNFDRRHAPGCGAGSPDGGYPAGTDAFGQPMVGIIGEWGIDMRTMTLHAPDSSYDFMGYCGGVANLWVSPYTYRAIAGALPRAGLTDPAARTLLVGYRPAGVAEPARQDEDEYLIGSIFVGADGAAMLRRGFYRLPLPPDIPAPVEEDGGVFAVSLLDVAGTLLGRWTFSPPADSESGHAEADEHDEEAPEDGFIHVMTPWEPGTAQIVISRGEETLLSVPVSAGAPQVTVLSPNGGETWSSGPAAISWAGSDPDGDPLVYTVEYSRDGGESWALLGDRISGTALALDTATLAGGPAALVRVTATDGVNTARDVSDAAFQVAGRAPQVAIIAPVDGAAVPVGAQVVFDAVAFDPEDGDPAPDRFVWTSSLDGELGRGPQLWGLVLSAGEHTITLTVTDSSGQAGSASVTLIVQNDPPEMPDLSFIEKWTSEGEAAAGETAEAAEEEAGPRLPVMIAIFAGGALALGGVIALVFMLGRRSARRGG
jgi:hypothetical protein